MVTGSEIAAAARVYLGTPFIHAGRDRHGLDCVGLLIAVARDLNLADYEPAPYSRQVDPARLRAEVERFCRPMALDAAREGDVLLFRVGGMTQHVGIHAGYHRFLHAYEWTPGKGQVSETALAGVWARSLVAVYRFREVV